MFRHKLKCFLTVICSHNPPQSASNQTLATVGEQENQPVEFCTHILKSKIKVYFLKILTLKYKSTI